MIALSAATRELLIGFVMASAVGAPLVYASSPTSAPVVHHAPARVPFDKDPEVRAYLDAVARHDAEVKAWEASRPTSRIGGYAKSDVAAAARQVARDAQDDAVRAFGTDDFYRAQRNAMHLNALANAVEDGQ